MLRENILSYSVVEQYNIIIYTYCEIRRSRYYYLTTMFTQCLRVHDTVITYKIIIVILIPQRVLSRREQSVEFGLSRFLLKQMLAK